jgi:hypothetical protein
MCSLVYDTLTFIEGKIMEKKIVGLKKLTKPNSIPVRLAAGGKELVRDNSKQRKYRVAGEKPLAQSN